jgi:hypothetical protein
LKQSNTHKTRRTSSLGQAVVHKSNGKRRCGAPAGNGNAKKGIVLPDWLKLDSSDEILTFMRKILIPYTLAGKIGTRQSSAICTAVKVLLDYDALKEIEGRVSRLEEERVKGN